MQDTLCFNCHFDFDHTLPFILNAMTQPSKAKRLTIFADPSGNHRVPPLDQDNSLEKGYPLQYSFLENSTDSEVWWVTVLGVVKSGTQWKD